jgi:hypothetical protein
MVMTQRIRALGRITRRNRLSHGSSIWTRLAEGAAPRLSEPPPTHSITLRAKASARRSTLKSDGHYGTYGTIRDRMGRLLVEERQGTAPPYP